MTFKPPFDFSELAKMFDPEQIAKLFDPETMKTAFEPPNIPGLDFQDMFQNNRNFEAMLTANKAAAQSYKDFYVKQMAILEEFMTGAKEHIDALGPMTGPESAEKQAETYRIATEKALALMAELASATREANAEAFSAIEGQVKTAIAELKQQ